MLFFDFIDVLFFAAGAMLGGIIVAAVEMEDEDE